MNYPDGTWECDAMAPWNRSETCGTCRMCVAASMLDGSLRDICVDDPFYPFEVRQVDESCDGWEAR